ncbi:MAG: 16S rRNA (guanine(527)-N(7))-methyltransferase RsmG [Maritimibacter sp.]
MERLDAYAELIKKWNKTINLVSGSSIDHLWSRHFLDSAQLFSHAPADATIWADMGTGGGFPGAVVAILAHESMPNLKVSCIESDLRKASFLQTVARQTGIKLNVFSRRIEEVPPLAAGVVSARALTSLSNLLGYAERHKSKDGICLFLKGAGADKEISEARDAWKFDCERIESMTDPDARILKVGEFSRA